MGRPSNESRRERNLHSVLDVEARHAALIDAVAANRRTLNACPGHQFDTTLIDWKRGHLPATFQCMRCGGFLPDLCAVEYARGFAAAGGNPELVIEGFTR